jgi:hypothetical protein
MAHAYIPQIADMITREFPSADQARNAAAGAPSKLSV